MRAGRVRGTSGEMYTNMYSRKLALSTSCGARALRRRHRQDVAAVAATCRESREIAHARELHPAPIISIRKYVRQAGKLSASPRRLLVTREWRGVPCSGCSAGLETGRDGRVLCAENGTRFQHFRTLVGSRCSSYVEVVEVVLNSCALVHFVYVRRFATVYECVCLCVFVWLCVCLCIVVVVFFLLCEPMLCVLAFVYSCAYVYIFIEELINNPYRCSLHQRLATPAKL